MEMYIDGLIVRKTSDLIGLKPAVLLCKIDAKSYVYEIVEEGEIEASYKAV